MDVVGTKCKNITKLNFKLNSTTKCTFIWQQSCKENIINKRHTFINLISYKKNATKLTNKKFNKKTTIKCTFSNNHIK